MEKYNSKYTHRTLMRVVIEAEGPLALGTGAKDIVTDSLVALDVNGFPYIPGTSIAGVLRHAMVAQNENSDLWGYQGKKNNGHGSEIIFSEAKVLNSDSDVMDGLLTVDYDDEVLKAYENLPVRQHVKMGHRGVAEKRAKFDNQIVPAGSRFCFEVEVMHDGKNNTAEQILGFMTSGGLRLGGGTRNGYGKMNVVDVRIATLCLGDTNQLAKYLEKTSCLSNKAWWEDFSPIDPKTEAKKNDIYELHLTPRDFFLFGSGLSDLEQDADMAPVMASKIEWKDGKGHVSGEYHLIPATSVKGAIRHRVAYHYNKNKGFFADKIEGSIDKYKPSDNKAVRELFGHEGEADVNSRGRLLFSDVVLTKEFTDKLINHVSIDRFTGGAIDGALFSELATYGNNTPLVMKIELEGEASDDARDALENALHDVCNSMLPLGGGVNRGNGMFTGKLTLNGKEIQ